MIISVIKLVCFLLLFVTVRILYLVLCRNGRVPAKKSRDQPAKSLIILGSGGHTTEILRVVQGMNVERYSPRIYVRAYTDTISEYKVKELEGDRTDYQILDIRRSREVGQSYLTSVRTTLVAILDSIPIIWKHRPELLLCNGPGTCVPLCLVAFLLKTLFLTDVRIVFIESFCRVKTLSMTGKILYYLADFVIVQWSTLAKLYKRTTYLD